MTIISIHKNLAPESVRMKLLSQIESDSDWRDNHLLPTRLHTDINKYPELKSIVDQHFSRFTFLNDGRIYFAKYPEGGSCLPHPDPCRFTLVVLLEEADEGGKLIVNGETANIVAGDGVLFYGYETHEVTTVVRGSRTSVAVWFK